MEYTEPNKGIVDLKKDFPIFKTKMNGKPLIYLDSAATSQKPIRVINAITDFYKQYNANIHRGLYEIAEKATEAYTNSKINAANFINAKGFENIIYLRNTTEAINLVALSWGNSNIKKGDHILISEMEHHSNIVPWQLLAKRTGAILDFIKLDEKNQRLDMQSLLDNLEKDPKIVAVTHVSNVLGTINDIKYITTKAHEHGSVVLVDAAQSVPHMKVDVNAIDADFLAFSSHKMLGPSGLGVLYGKTELLESMEPLLGGGDMIHTVTHNSYSWNSLPWKFEAGTQNIEGAIGFSEAINYLNSAQIEDVRMHEQKLAKYALDELSDLGNIEIFGLMQNDIHERLGVISFNVKGMHSHDLSHILSNEGIAIRAGHHCAMPIVTESLHQSAVARMSFYLYNNESDIDKAVKAIQKAKKIFKIK